MRAMMLFGKYVRAESDGNLSRSPTHDDDTSSMDETSTSTSTSTSRKRKLAATTSPNQLNGLSLGHVDMDESSRKKRKLTTTNPNQQDAYYLLDQLSLESFAKIERNLATRCPPNDQEDGLSLGLPTASSTQQDQPPPMQNPNQKDELSLELSLGFPTAPSTQEDQHAMQNPNQEDDLSLGFSTASSTQEDQPAIQNRNQDQPAIQNRNQDADGLSLGLSLSSSTQEDQPAMQNPNQEDEEVEEQEQQQEEEEEVEEEEEQQQQEEEEVEEQEQQQEEEEEEEQEQQEEEEEEEEEVVEEEEQQQQEVPAPAPIPIFMFEKKLTSSDVERNHNRLLISGHANNLMASLTEEERGRVESNGRRDFLRMVTMTMDINYGVEYILHLKRWAGSGALVLKHEWGKLVRANKLRIGDSVEGRGYRVDDELRLVLDINRNHQVH